MKKKKQAQPKVVELEIKPEEEPLAPQVPQDSAEEDEDEVASEQKQSLPIETEDISDWYHDENEDAVDMSKIERRKKRNKWPWIFGFGGALVLVAALAFSYTWYQAQRPVTDGTGTLDMKVAEKTASGEAITIELTYENQDTVSLRTSKIEVVYPDGFEFQSANPTPSSGDNTWEVENLASGRGGKIYITGQLVGEVGTQKIFSAFFTYRPENLNYDFQESLQKSVSITSSTISVTLDSPQQVRSGQEVEIVAEFKNTSKTPLKNIQVTATPPAGFSVTSADPEVDSTNDLVWRFEELQPEGTETITIKGVVTGDSGQEQAVTFQAGFIEIDGRFNIQVEKQALMLVINPSVALTLTAPETVAPGDDLSYEITVTNTSDIELKEVKLRLLLTGDWFTEEAVDVPVIEVLKANASESVTLTTTLKSEAGVRDLDLTGVVSVRNVKIDGEQTTITGTATAKTTVEGSLSFSAQARYFDDDLNKIGEGPVPPKVNEQTTYVVWWDVASGPSDLKELTISAKLPADVTFESGGSNIAFDKKTHTVSYTGSTLSAGDTKHLTFSVSIIPTQDDFNGLMVLLEAGSAQAIDTSTDDTLTAVSVRLTTNLDGDPAAEGEGVVE